MQRRNLILQSLLLALSLITISSEIWNFPYPSPLVRPLLAPQQRWPEAQIKEWVERDTYQPGFVTFFMRDPDRNVPGGQNLVSPADGILVEIAHVADTLYFIVGLSFWDVHVVRSPVAGKVIDIQEQGFSIFRDHSESTDQVFLLGKAGPVQKIVSISTPAGEYRVRLITSWWASRIKVSARIGQNIGKGERIGRILLGSSVVVDAPASTAFIPKVGSRMVGGETIIAGLSANGAQR